MWATSTVIPNNTQQSQLKLSKLPQVFEHNLGQFDNNYSYIAHTPETFFAFAKDHVNLVLNTRDKRPTKSLKMQFLDINKNPSITGLFTLPQRVNYLRGKSSQWIQNVPTFQKIQYDNIYPGINLQFHFKQSKMEFDFIVSPGKDPRQISFTIENADNIKLSSSGELQIAVNGELLIQKAPVLYQTVLGQRQAIEGKFIQQGNRISFEVGQYDPAIALVIDPIIEFSSYFGGDWEDQANVIKTDSNGNIFVAGSTSAQARITVANILTSEAVPLATKENEEEKLPGEDAVIFQADHGISLDADIIAGGSLDLDANEKITEVNGVAVTEDYEYNCDYEYSGFFSNDRIVVDYDAFLSKFDSDFNLIFTTYIGGCRNDSIRAMTIDNNDNIYVTGLTLSEDFPIKFPAQETIAKTRFQDGQVQGDAFYAKFENDGFLLFASFLGGDGQDGGRDITVDDDENIYITGYSHSRNLATTPCPTVGKRVIACDNIGGVDVSANEAGSTDISVYSDAFVAKIAAEGDVISFLTYFGGEFDDWGQSIRIHDDAIYVAGNTASSNLPVGDLGEYSYMPYNVNKTKDEIEANRQELFCTRLQEENLVSLRIADAHVCQDVFIAKLQFDDEKGSYVEFSTYFGGDDDDNVSKMEIDSSGNIYLIGTTKSKGVRLDSGAAGTIERDDLIKLEDRFPLYKNINQYEFDLDSIVTSSFFAVFNPTADKLIVSSFIGGDNNDTGNAIAIRENPVNGDGETLVDIYLAGHTLSENFFTKNSFQSNSAESDIYLLNLALNLSKKDDDYDTDNPDNPDRCSKNSCNLYDLKYSTLIGGENLDSLKSIALLPNNEGLVLAGITFSSFFPVTSSASKDTITGITQQQYDPFTREIIDTFVFHPSDMFLMKVSDDQEDADLSITMTIVDESNIVEGEDINYAITIKNNSATITAKSVRLFIKHPYVARLENIENIISINLSTCKKDIKQMYCIIGDLAPSATQDVFLKIETRNSGDFSISTSVSSMTADSISTNNDIFNTTTIRVKADAASLNFGGLVILFFVYLLSIYHRLNKTSAINTRH